MEISFTPIDNSRLTNLCGVLDEYLKQIETALDVGIAFTLFQGEDVVRHPLVQKIVNAYQNYEARTRPGGAEQARSE